MYLLMMLHTMGKTYKMLPSQILETATTIDLYVLEKALAYLNLPKDNDGRPILPPKQYSQAELQAMVDAVKARQ
jgi:hypothetical protein